jgi:hypothetical protein
MSKQKEIYTLNYWKNKGYTEESAYLEIKKEKRKNHFLCKEYWIERGYSEESAINKISKIQKDNGKNIDHKSKKNQYRMDYWLESGNTPQEALNKIEEAKNKSNPYKNWNANELNLITQKRNATYYFKTSRERGEINKRRGRTTEQLIQKFGEEKANSILRERGKGRRNNFFRRYSKISESFFNELQQISNLQLFYGKDEKWIRYNKNKGFYVDCLFNKKIIEFNGDFYHANPLIYNKDSIIKISANKILKAEQIWNKDLFKKKKLEELGYIFFIIWEKDIKENRNAVLEKCVNFLKYE